MRRSGRFRSLRDRSSPPAPLGRAPIRPSAFPPPPAPVPLSPNVAEGVLSSQTGRTRTLMSGPSPRWPPEMEKPTPGGVQVGRMQAAERILGTFLQESSFGTSWRQVGTATLKWGGFIPVSFFLKFTFLGVFVAFRETLAHGELLSPTSVQLGIKHSSLRNHL